MEENRIRISEFKPVTKFKFINGLLKKVEKSLESKEIEFYNISKDTRDRLLKNNNIDSATNEEFLYKLIPIISNVDMDISLKEFSDLCELGGIAFVSFINACMDNFVDLFKQASEINSIENKMVELQEFYEVEIPHEPIKTKEEQLQELYDELTECKDDKVRRKEILKQITNLEIDDNE